MKRALRLAAVVLPALTAGAPALEAQRVELRGRGDIEHDVYLRGVIDGGDYTLIARDTLIGRADTIRGDVLVAGATLRLEGTIAGDLLLIDANAFLRPTARVLGDVRNIAGGLYPSEQATIQGSIRSEPNAEYMIERSADGSIVIAGTTHASSLVLDGFQGVLIPTYDRVNGLTLGIGVGYLLPRIGRVEPIVRGRAEYYSQRGDFGGGLELAAARGRTELAFGAEHTFATNDRWIRSDFTNTISALAQGKDRRDYFGVDRAYAELRRLLESGPRVTNAFLRAQLEDAEPLDTGTPWSLFGDFRQDNIEFEPSRIASVRALIASEWIMNTHALELLAAFEAGGELLDGDHAFAMYSLDADWAMPALANHTLRLEPHFQGPLPGTTSLPGQRWGFVGGSGTMTTFEDAEFRGDRIAFVETSYSIPLTARLRTPILGIPALELLHAAGMAWTAEESRRFEQNVGIRLAWSMAYVRVMTNPEHFADDVKVSVGVRAPARTYPWQTAN
ncbi:MAG: polymer-forming cytoskeletal protein [Gemmatimonadota bacterium]